MHVYALRSSHRPLDQLDQLDQLGQLGQLDPVASRTRAVAAPRATVVALLSRLAAAFGALTLAVPLAAAPPVVTFISQFPWDTGYNGSITILNPGPGAVENWSLSFSGGPEWSSLWNGEATVVGGVSTVTHPEWSTSIAPGETWTIGFVGVGQLTESVVDCTVNDVPAVVEYVGAIPAPVVPAISIEDVTITLAALVDPGREGTSGHLSTSGNQIVDDSGTPVRITGINWFGFETGTRVAHGLWARNWKSMLEQVLDLGFNTLRIPFSNEMLAPGATTNSINTALNPDLVGLSPIEVLDAIVGECGVLGLRVILDRHSAMADNYYNEDLWYIPGSPVYTEERWISDWTMLAARYAGNPTVIGADLFNEPKRTATWGDSSPATDWNKAAERCADAIHAVNPHWLIFVEGTEKFGGESTWWGGNLLGAALFPIVIDTPSKLVYSAHDYPSTIFPQPWFGAPDYPANLPAVWQHYWGYLFEDGTAPMFIGEFGSKIQTVSDQQWLSTLTQYMDGDFDLDGISDLVGAQRGISWTFWSLNPNSSDTGGILNDDWTTVNTEKLAYLQPSLAPLLAPGSGTQPPQIMQFPVTLSEATSLPVSVPWSTVDGTAVAGVDFVGASGVLHFEQGVVQRTIPIVVPPHAASVTTQFEVVLGAPVNATIVDGVAVGTIVVVAACTGDLDGNGIVDGADLGAMLAGWGAPGSAADLDGNGVVDGADLGVLLAAWGTCMQGGPG